MRAQMRYRRNALCKYKNMPVTENVGRLALPVDQVRMRSGNVAPSANKCCFKHATEANT